MFAKPFVCRFSVHRLAASLAALVVFAANEAPPLLAQAAQADDKKVVEPKVGAGELRVDGRVKSVLGNDRFVIEVTSFTTSKGKTVELKEAKPKNITVNARTVYHERGDDTKKLALPDVKLGRRVTIVGRDAGSGKAMPARQVVVWPEAVDYKHLTTVRVSRASAQAIDAGDAVHLLGDLPNALRLFERAVAVAGGDRPGRALALGRVGIVYMDLDEPQKALDVFTQEVGLWAGLGNRDNHALGLSHLASALSSLDQDEKALETMEQAAGLVRNSPNRRIVATLHGRLASYYAAAGQLEKALTTFEQVLPLVRGQSDKGAEADLLADMASTLSAMGQEDRARQTIEQVVPMLGSIGDKRERAVVLQTVGRVYAGLDEREKALDHFRQALPLLRELGDRRGAARTQASIERLQKGDKPAGEDA